VKQGKNRFQFSILTFQLFFVLIGRKLPSGTYFSDGVHFFPFVTLDSYLVARVVELSVIVCFVTWTNKQVGGIQPFCSRGQHYKWEVSLISGVIQVVCFETVACHC